MDDDFSLTILDPLAEEVIESDKIIEHVFRRQSAEQNIPIDELVFNPSYQKKVYK